MVSALSLCYRTMKLRGHAEPLTLLHCFATHLKADSSVQASVIVHGFKALQNNSFA